MAGGKVQMQYYFDIFDGATWARDDFGIDCQDDHSARQQAVLALTEMAREQLPHNGDFAKYRIRVRGGARSRFTVTLDFATEREGVGSDIVSPNLSSSR